MSPLNNNNHKTSSSGREEPAYFFLYDQPFMGFEPPFNFLLFCIAPSILYLLCVYVIFPAMAPRSKTAVLLVSKLRYWHNVALCLYSGFACSVAVTEMIEAKEFHFWTLKLDDMMPMLCNQPSDWFKWVNYTFIWSKVYEMLDTGFIVWLKNDHARAILEEANPSKKKKKEITTNGDEEVEGNRSSVVSRATGTTTTNKKNKTPSELNFLHVYHHCTTFWLFLLCADLPSSTKLGPLMNGFVHFLMYAHYSKPFPKPLVPFITLSQIAQLAFVTWAWYLTATHCPEYSEFKTKHFYEYWTNYLFVPVYFVFFVKFFFERFILGMLFGKKKKE